MAIEVPNIQIMTYDYSQVSPILEDTLVTGVVIDAPTGPLEVTKVSSLSEFLSLYTTTGDITADDHVTMLHTAKLLQFTPVYVSRACSSEVLPARSDTTSNDGSSIVFTDTTFNPYYKEFKWEFQQADDAEGAYVVFRVASGSGTVLSTEDGAFIYTEDGDFIRIESSTNTLTYTYYAILMANSYSKDDSSNSSSYTLNFMDESLITNSENASMTIFKIGDKGLLPFLSRYLGIDNVTEDSVIEFCNLCSIDFILKNFNSLLDILSDQYNNVPEERLSKVSVSNNYINVSNGLYIELDNIYPKPTIIDNVSNNKYKMLTFNKSDNYSNFTGDKTDVDGNKFTGVNGIAKPYSNGIGSSDYFNINGISYYKTSNSENTNIPGTLDPLTIYKGYNSTGLEFDVSSDRMSTQDFFVYMLDKQMEENNIKPVLSPSKLSYTLSLKSLINYKPNSSVNEYRLDSISVKLLGKQLNKLLRVTDYSTNSKALTAADLEYNKLQVSNITASKEYFIKTGFDCVYQGSGGAVSVTGFTKLSTGSGGNVYKFNNGTYTLCTTFTNNDLNAGLYIKIDDDNYMLIPVIKEGDINFIEVYSVSTGYKMKKIDSYQSIDRLEDGVVKFELNMKSSSNNLTHKESLYFVINSYVEDRYDPNYDHEMDDANLDNTFVFTDIHTIQKLVYRIAEFFSYENKYLVDRGIYSSYWKTTLVTVSGNQSYSIGDYDKVYSIVNDPTIYYYKSDIESNITSLYNSVNIDDSKVIINLEELSEGTDVIGYKFHDYNITNSDYNLSNKVYRNQWVKVTRMLPEASPQITIFYNGTYPKAQQPGETLVRISSAKLTYLQFYNELVASMKTKYNLAPITGGIAIYEYDTGCDYSIEDSGIFVPGYDSKTKRREKDYTELLEKSALIVVSKYVSNDNICKFSIEVDEDDPELYNLKLTRKGNSTDYVISFNPSKTDGYGIARFYTYVNDEDNGSRDFYLFRLNESDQNVPADKVVSPYFGSEVMTLKAGVTDYKLAYERFEEFTGTYYDFIFDAGYANTAVANCISNLCQKIYALGILTCPDIYDYNQLITYRQSIGVDHWSSVLQAPRTPDTTLGEYVINMSPGCQYLQRIILNKNGGKEFAPCFWFTNGSVTLKPKYKYMKKDVQKALVNQQISPIIWDRARQQAYFCLDLTTQSADSSLSDANNVRMINVMAHLCDNIAQGYIGRYNDEATRNEFVAALDLAIRTRMINNQQYKPDDYRIICNETNNPVEQIELRNLIVDILVKFRPGIRYVKVYQKVYKLSQDLSAV